jgi:ABC-type transport system involved in multi-copper enzyme maturation permease subunit
VGRSADTLGNLPPRSFGPTMRAIGRGLSKVFPNLHIYVPARPLLLGEVDGQPVWSYVGRASLYALAYAVVALALSALIFRKRDFQ